MLIASCKPECCEPKAFLWQQAGLTETDAAAVDAGMADAASALAGLRAEQEELRGLAEQLAAQAERTHADNDRLRKAAEDAALDRCVLRSPQLEQRSHLLKATNGRFQGGSHPLSLSYEGKLHGRQSSWPRVT